MPIAVQRKGTQFTLIPRGDTVFEAGDTVFLSPSQEVDGNSKAFGQEQQTHQNVMILEWK